MVAAEAPEGRSSEYLCYDDDRVIAAGWAEHGILPVTAVFGANAFGKSNFVDALRLIQNLVLDPPKKGDKIPASPFSMDLKAREMPSSFNLRILSGENQYTIFIKLSRDEVIEERVSIMAGDSDKTMYHRKGGSVTAGDGIAAGNHGFPEEAKAAMKAARENTLLLSGKTFQKLDDLKPIYNWFKESLMIMSASVKFVYARNSDALTARVGEALKLLDTGIEAIEMTPVSIGEVPLTRGEISELRENLKSKEAAYFMAPGNEMFVMKSENGEISANLANIVKESRAPGKIHARASEESDGTQRLLRLLPAFLQLGEDGGSNVLIVDELDKSLHTKMTRGLIEYHLNNVSSGSKSQLVFTAHDVDLIDNSVLRDDEIWIVEKDHDGVSEMMCLDDYGLSEEGMTFKQMYKSHSLGGTPRIFLLSSAQLAEVADDPRG